MELYLTSSADLADGGVAHRAAQYQLWLLWHRVGSADPLFSADPTLVVGLARLSRGVAMADGAVSADGAAGAAVIWLGQWSTRTQSKVVLSFLPRPSSSAGADSNC